MSTEFFENTGKNVQFIGGKMILPGEIREINAGDLPAKHRAPAPDQDLEQADGAKPTLHERMLEVLKKPVASVISAMSALTAEELAALRELESEGAARKSLLHAIDAEILELASKKLDQPTAPDA